MKRLPKIHRADWNLTPVDPDPGFDPEHNRQVIENSIKKYEATRRKKAKEYEDQVKERSAALATYLKSAESGGANSDINKYFGKKHLVYLRGQQILDQVRTLNDVKAHS